MDMKALQCALPSSKFAPDSNAEYTFKNPRRQLFDLPYSIMKHMIENANGAKDLYPVDELLAHMNDKITIDGKDFLLAKFKDAPKSWLYKSLSRGYASNFKISKNFKFDLRVLDLRFQRIIFEEYQTLTASGTIEKMTLHDVNVIQSDGISITSDILFENLRNLKELSMRFQFEKMLFETVKKMTEILPRLQKLRIFSLKFFDESFDFSFFSEFLMKNETVDVYLQRFRNLSDAYKQMLETFMENCMRNPPKRIPYISFPGCDKVKFAEYRALYYC
uniref:DUF38 domain-containing protein n=1 Tax=Panagrolaimus sp. ES5 TaxID=591445 RepID=A0AC34F4Z8_9BILA